MNRMITPALVVMASLAVLAPAFGAETPGAKGLAGEPDIAGIAKRVYPSVVRVEVDSRNFRIVATGVVVEKGGYVVTTALVLPRDEKITLTTSEGRKVAAEFLGFDTETQVALLKAEDAGLPALPLGRAADLAPGSWIAVVGVSPERTAAVTQGIVSSVGADRLRLNVWVTPGSSGGPVVDANGRMVGLLRGIYMDERPVVFQFRDREQSGSGVVLGSRAEAPSSGMALAVPVDIVAEVAGQIKEKGKVERGWLGVGIGRNEDGRTVIGTVDEDSPAELAKLRPGDVVLKFADKDISGPDALAAEVRRKKPGQDVTLRIERDGKAMDVRLKLGEYPEDEARREMAVRFPDLFGTEARPAPAPSSSGTAPAGSWAGSSSRRSPSGAASTTASGGSARSSRSGAPTRPNAPRRCGGASSRAARGPSSRPRWGTSRSPGRPSGGTAEGRRASGPPTAATGRFAATARSGATARCRSTRPCSRGRGTSSSTASTTTA